MSTCCINIHENMSIILREYQKTAINMLKSGFSKHKRQVLCAPTGSGKTVIFAQMVYLSASNGTSTLVYSYPHHLHVRAEAATIAPHAGQSLTGGAFSFFAFGFLSDQIRSSLHMPCLSWFFPKSNTVNISFVGVLLLPRPHICSHSGNDNVALLTIITSIVGQSKPVVRIPQFTSTGNSPLS